MKENQFLEEERPEAAQVDLLLTKKSTQLPSLVYVEPESKVNEVMQVMSEYGITQVPVLSGNDCVGQVLEARLTRQILEKPETLQQQVSSVMEAPIPVVNADANVSDLMKLLRNRKSPAVLVKRHGVLTGIISRHDLIEYLSNA